MKSNRGPVFLFIALSYLATFLPGREVFPIFNWALFGKAPDHFAYKKLLISKNDCGLKHKPLEHLFPSEDYRKSEVIDLLNQYGKNSEVIATRAWQYELLRHIESVCASTSDLTLEEALVKGDPLKLWQSGEFEKILKVQKRYVLE